MRKIYQRLIFASTSLVMIILLFLGGYLLLYRRAPSQVDSHGPTLADFGFVHLGMTMDEIDDKLGLPRRSPSFTYKYELADKSVVVFRTDGSERVKGVCVLHQDGTRTDFFTGEGWPELSLDDFDFLQLDMPYDKVIEKVGEPHMEGGSMIHSAVYKLADGGAVVLNLGTRLLVTGPMPIVANAWITTEGHIVNFFDNK